MNAIMLPTVIESAALPITLAHCVDMVTANIIPESRRVYPVQLENGTISLRRAMVYRNRIELFPESTAAHAAFVITPRIRRNRDVMSNSDVTIIGLVYSWFYELYQDEE
jgi:hypothetical protein